MVDISKQNLDGSAKMKLACVVSYYKGMGGVDHSDQISAICQSVKKHTKRCKKLLFYMIGISYVNAFLLYKRLHSDKKITLNQFKVELARQLLKDANVPDYSS